MTLTDNRQALDRICAVLTEYWRGKNTARTDSGECPASRTTHFNQRSSRGAASAPPSGMPLDKT